jgi:hypothetical protein
MQLFLPSQESIMQSHQSFRVLMNDANLNENLEFVIAYT